MKSFWTATTGVVLAIGGLAACGGADETAADMPFARYDTKGNPGGDAASLTGTLEVAEDCVYVVVGGSKVVPVFPSARTEVDDGELILNGRRFAQGDDVEFGGGEHQAKPRDAVVPDGCSGDSYWVVAPG